MATHKTPPWKDFLLLAAELAAKQAYWRLPWTKSLAKRIRGNSQPAEQVCDRAEFERYLRRIGVTQGALVMAHTSVAGLRFTDAIHAERGAFNAISAANRLVDILMNLVGPNGTLVMPTNAAYQNQEASGKEEKPIEYNPATTPSDIGLANELFRRRKGVKRSLHPFNMVAAYGPLAEELLRDNIAGPKPLPHGIHSPYYRFCLKNGLVISIGVPLGQCLTLMHTAEDVRDEQWPIKDFFEERKYLVRDGTEDRLVVARHSRARYNMYCRCRFKCIRDLVGEGILHEGQAGSIRVDWAHSREIFDYLMSRTEKKPYPIYCTWLAYPKR